MAIVTLSAGFTAFGRQCASKKYFVFVLSLILTAFMSWPTIHELRHLAMASSTMIPTTTTHDYFWQYSPHIQPLNSTTQLSFDNITHIACQIRFAQQADRTAAAGSAGSERLPVDQTLLARARAWQYAFTAQVIDLEDDAEDRKKTIALEHIPSFILISPFDHYWLPNEPIPVDWTSSVNADRLDPLTVFDNVTLDEYGQLMSADAIIITAVVPRDIAVFWTKAVEQQLQNQPLSWHVRQMRAPIHYSQQVWQYRYSSKGNLSMVLSLPVTTTTCFFIALHLLVFFIVSNTFARSPLVNSPYCLGMVTVMISVACVAISLTVLNHFEVNTDAIPWYLLSLVSTVATVENQLLLTNAVVHAGCDMSVPEKVGHGLQSVGVPMLGTLVAELIILEIGLAIQSVVIQQFCQFAQVVLIIEYMLEMTLFVAILSIDIHRAQLADLADHHVSKRLRELAKNRHHCHEASYMSDPNFCPVQDSSTKEHDGVARKMSCAECKKFKTHRAVNALMLCVVILSISLFQSINSHNAIVLGVCKDQNDTPTRPSPSASLVAERLQTASIKYWEMTNPFHETQWIQVEPPILLVSNSKTTTLPSRLLPESFVYEEQYRINFHRGKSSRFRTFALARVQQTLALLWNINVPLCTLLAVFMGIITWLYSSYRNQPLLVLLLKTLEGEKATSWRHMTTLSTTVSHQLSSVEKRHQQDRRTVGELTIKTLAGQHVADIHRFDVNEKHHLAVSCGHDDRMVVWNTQTGKLVRRLDSTCSIRQVRIDRNGKWIASVMSDGAVCVWDVQQQQQQQQQEAAAIRKFMAETEQQQQDDATTSAVVPTRTCQRKQRALSSSTTHAPIIDRVQDVRFIGSAQNSLVTVHKSGTIREWDILTGVCVHTIASEHKHGITVLHVVEPNRLSPSEAMASWVFLASRDGRISCWRHHTPAASGNSSAWTCTYSIPSAHGDGHAITALVVEPPPLSSSGMGLVVTGASDGSIKVWHLQTGKPICTLQDSNLAATVSRLVVTRYCESTVDGEPTASCCCSSDTCSGSGFLVASYSLVKNRVSIWRLEYVGNSANSSSGCCTWAAAGSTQCSSSRRYHRSQYRKQQRKGSNTNTIAIANQQLFARRNSRETQQKRQEAVPDILDIEHLGDEDQSGLATIFLGSIVQYGGRGIAFCSSGDSKRLILTGIRLNRSSGHWEVWSTASLLHQQQFSKPTVIPVDTLMIVGDSYHDNNNEDDDDASELLPFTAVRHVLPLADSHGNPGGFACDFGNFIKIVVAPKGLSACPGPVSNGISKPTNPAITTATAYSSRPTVCSILSTCPRSSECRTPEPFK